MPDDNSRQSSVDDSPVAGYAQHVEHVSTDNLYGQRPPEICPEDRAKIYALFQMPLSSCPKAAAKKASASRCAAGVDNRLERNHTDDAGELTLKRHRDSTDQSATQPPTRKQSGAKRFGLALKNLFMNEQQQPRDSAERRARMRRDSWDDLYKSKDPAKVRPHEYDSAYLGTL